MSNKHAPEKRCSFCGKARGVVKALVEGEGKVRICDECVRTCGGILERDASVASAARQVPLTLADAAIYLRQHAKVLRTVTSSDAGHVEELADAVTRIIDQFEKPPTDTTPMIGELRRDDSTDAKVSEKTIEISDKP